MKRMKKGLVAALLLISINASAVMPPPSYYEKQVPVAAAIRSVASAIYNMLF